MNSIRDVVSGILSTTIVRPSCLQGQPKDSVLLDFARDIVEGSLIEPDQAQAIATRLKSAAVQSIEGLGRKVLGKLDATSRGVIIKGPIVDSGTGILTRLEFRKEANRTLILVLGRPVEISILDPAEMLTRQFASMEASAAQQLIELINELIPEALANVGCKLPSLILSGKNIETPDIEIEGKPLKVRFVFNRVDNGRDDNVVLQLTGINFTNLNK